MDQYLSGTNVPGFLRLPMHFPMYKAVDFHEDDPQDAEKENNFYQRYRKYYDNLNYDGRLFDERSRSATGKYYRAHRVQKPATVPATNQGDLNELRKHFNSYVNLPTVLSGHPLSGIMYHSAVSLESSTYLFGGLECMLRDEYETLLRKITKDFTIPPENITATINDDLPPAVSRDKLLMIGSRPNLQILKYSPESKTLTVLSGLTGQSVQLICGSATAVSKNTVMVYGGFRLETEYVYPDATHLEIHKKIVPVNDLFVYDLKRLAYRRLRMSVHPTYNAAIASPIPRFGHRMVAVTVEQNNEPGSYERPTVLFVMGGYRLCDDGRSFMALNDLWKCEIFCENGEFSDEIICCPIGNFSMVGDKYSVVTNEKGELLTPSQETEEFMGIFNCYRKSSWPAPRGFFAMALVDRPNTIAFADDEATPSSTASEISRSSSSAPSARGRGSSPSSRLTRTTSSDSSPSMITGSGSFPVELEALAHTYNIRYLNNKMLVLYGGSSTRFAKVKCDNGKEASFSKRDVLGDVWWFDFRREKWKRMETRLSKNMPFELNLCGHEFAVTKNRLLVFGGMQLNQLPMTWAHPKCEASSKDMEPEEVGRCYQIFTDLCIRDTTQYPNSMYSITSKTDIGFHPINHKVKEVCDNRTYYSTYMFNLNTLRWSILEFLYVQCLRRTAHMPNRVIFVCAPVTQADSRLLVIGGDLRILDNESQREVTEVYQGLYGGGVDEVYTPYAAI